MSDTGKILVTGSGSGLGRFLNEEFNGTGFTREDSVEAIDPAERFDMIVHCAFSGDRNPTRNDIYPYIEDNLLLTYELTKIPTAKFIYISSIDVYPGNGLLHEEDEVISMQEGLTDYGRIKLYAEAIVRKRCSNHLIIRPGLLLGKYTRKNNLVKVLEGSPCQLTLTADSTFNCVTYHSLLALILNAQEKDITGIYNAVSNDRVALNELTVPGDREIVFGDYQYRTARISNLKAAGICKEFDRSSLAAISDFVGQTAN
jgi:dTDP-4-dehydrorhamnose reductase